MNCPFCGYHDSRVIDSRYANDGIRRRRQCQSCNSRFTTYERLQPENLFIIKKDQRREEFNKEKEQIDFDTCGNFYGYEYALKALKTDI